MDPLSTTSLGLLMGIDISAIFALILKIGIPFLLAWWLKDVFTKIAVWVAVVLFDRDISYDKWISIDGFTGKITSIRLSYIKLENNGDKYRVPLSMLGAKIVKVPDTECRLPDPPKSPPAPPRNTWKTQ